MKWFRFYSGVLDDPKVQRLPAELFRVWVNLLCLANEAEDRGTLPGIADLAFRLRLDEGAALAALEDLTERGLIERDGETLRPHNWDRRQFRSDDVTPRVQKHRAQRYEPVTGNVTSAVTETPPDTDTDTESEADTETDPETEQTHTQTPRGGELTARERAFSTLIRGRVSPKCATQTLDAVPEARMTAVAFEAMKFGNYWQSRDLKRPDQAWINWLKKDSQRAEQEAVAAEPAYYKPFPDYR